MGYGIIHSMKRICFLAAMAFGLAATAETVVNISGVGAQKFTVSIQVANGAYSKCLAKNLEISGLFTVRGDGTIKVSGASGAMKAEGRGKVVSSAEVFSDDKSARMAARRFADAMCEAFGNQKGFALDRLRFLNRGKSAGRGQVRPSEMCVSYPDGYDVRQLTSDGRMTIFQRWKDRDTVMYISDLKGSPQVWELNTATGNLEFCKWNATENRYDFSGFAVQDGEGTTYRVNVLVATQAVQSQGFGDVADALTNAFGAATPWG